MATLNRDLLNSHLNRLNPNHLNRLRNRFNLNTHLTRDLKHRLLRKRRPKNNFNLSTRSIGAKHLPRKHHLLLKHLPHRPHLSCNHRYRLILRDLVAVLNPVTGR